MAWGIAVLVPSFALASVQSTTLYTGVDEQTPREEKIVLIREHVDWTEKRTEKEIRETFPEAPNTAVAVAKSESGVTLDANAYNPEWHYDRYGNPICQGSYGVMQIACVHMKDNPDALFEIELNLKVARRLYEERGWEPWGGYTSGGYKRHI